MKINALCWSFSREDQIYRFKIHREKAAGTLLGPTRCPTSKRIGAEILKTDRAGISSRSLAGRANKFSVFPRGTPPIACYDLPGGKSVGQIKPEFRFNVRASLRIRSDGAGP